MPLIIPSFLFHRACKEGLLDHLQSGHVCRVFAHTAYNECALHTRWIGEHEAYVRICGNIVQICTADAILGGNASPVWLHKGQPFDALFSNLWTELCALLNDRNGAAYACQAGCVLRLCYMVACRDSAVNAIILYVHMCADDWIIWFLSVAIPIMSASWLRETMVCLLGCAIPSGYPFIPWA